MPDPSRLVESPLVKKVKLQYGTEGVELTVDAPNVTVIEPRFVLDIVVGARADGLTVGPASAGAVTWPGCLRAG